MKEIISLIIIIILKLNEVLFVELKMNKCLFIIILPELIGFTWNSYRWG